MSADYDRLFHPPDAVQLPDEDAGTVDRDPVSPGTAGPIPTHAAHSEAPSGPMPVAAPVTTTTAPAPPQRQSEITSQIRPAQSTGPQRVQNEMMRAPQGTVPAGAR